jgi:hypothetical protein
MDSNKYYSTNTDEKECISTTDNLHNTELKICDKKSVKGQKVMVPWSHHHLLYCN